MFDGSCSPSFRQRFRYLWTDNPQPQRTEGGACDLREKTAGWPCVELGKGREIKHSPHLLLPIHHIHSCLGVGPQCGRGAGEPEVKVLTRGIYHSPALFTAPLNVTPFFTGSLISPWKDLFIFYYYTSRWMRRAADQKTLTRIIY